MLGLMCLLAQWFELSEKAGIISEEPHGTESDFDSEEAEPAMLDLAQLFASETEDEDFDGFD